MIYKHWLLFIGFKTIFTIPQRTRRPREAQRQNCRREHARQLLQQIFVSKHWTRFFSTTFTIPPCSTQRPRSTTTVSPASTASASTTSAPSVRRWPGPSTRARRWREPRRLGPTTCWGSALTRYWGQSSVANLDFFFNWFDQNQELQKWLKNIMRANCYHAHGILSLELFPCIFHITGIEVKIIIFENEYKLLWL